MTYGRNQPNEDIKHPILNDILHSQKEIRWLFNRGYHWRAVLNFKTMASGLYLFTPELYEELDELIAQIDKIEVDSYNYVKGITDDFIQNNRERYRDSHARRLFPELNRKLAIILITAGFVQAPDNFKGFDLKPPALRNKSGKRKEPREGLTISSSRAGEHKKEI